MSISERCVQAMENYYRDRMKQIGSNHPNAHPMVRIADGNVLDLKAKNKNGLDVMDCITFVLKVLRDGCNLTELQTDQKYKGGIYLSKYLVDRSWGAHFWCPDVYRKGVTRGGRPDGEHTVSFQKAINAPKVGSLPYKTRDFIYKPPFEYYGVKLSGMVVGYNRQEPDTDVTNKTANQQAFDRLKKVKFCVGICRGGEHTFLMSNGVVWEVHWTEMGGDSLYEKTDFEKFIWFSGIVVTPPDSGFTSRPISEIIAAIKKADSGFLCRNLNLFCK